MVVLTFSGVPSVGGMVIGGRTGVIFELTKLSFTKEVSNELLPTDSSPQTHIRTVAIIHRTFTVLRSSEACLCQTWVGQKEADSDIG